MKRILFAIVISSVGTAYAACKLPDNIENRDFIMEVSDFYGPSNPMAGNVYKMQYYGDGKYNYKVLNNGSNYTGKYKYEKVANNIGIISSEEMFGADLTQYTLTLMCNNANSGVYFYQQSDGVAGSRSNTSRYFLLN